MPPTIGCNKCAHHKSLVRRAAMAAGQDFTYSPRHLPGSEVRILTLLSGHNSSPIRCRLDTASLENQPIYDALSYMWGQPNQFRWITINDRRFPIRGNLHLALYNLRSSTADRILWIDAICINQNDLEERNYQVGQMGRIFAQARTVHVWVGDRSHDSGIAVSMLRELGSADEISDKWNKDLKSRDAWSKWNAVFKFLLRSYWSRVWIIQEIAMASTIVIHCGQDTIPWDFLSKALLVVKYMLKTKHKIKPSIWGLSKDDWAMMLDDICDTHPLQLSRQRALRFAGDSDAFDIDILLGISHRSSCTDLRDKIYGLLGLIRDSSMPIDYTRVLFSIYGDMLQHLKQDEVRGLSLIHDFTTVRFSQSCQSLLRGPCPNVNQVRQLIKLRGICSDTILVLVSYCFTARNDVISVTETGKIAAELYQKSEKWNISKSKVRKETVLKERLRGFGPVSVVKAIKVHAFTARKSSHPPSPGLIDGLKVWTQKCQLGVAVSERPVYIAGRRNPKPLLFWGSRGQIGFVPSLAQEGDIICQFLSSDVVAVLR